MSTSEPSDQNRKISASDALLHYKADIERSWADAVRKSIKATTALKEPVLFNFVPLFITSLAESLQDGSNRMLASEGSTAAQEHGAERVRLTELEASHVVSELQILKETIYTLLDEKNALAKNDRIKIEKSFDQAIKESIMGFVLAESQLREQSIAMLTHDIRNPVAFISMASDMLIEGVEDAKEAKEIYQRISANAKKADQLIQNILDMHLVKSRQKPKLDIGETDILQLVEASAANWKSKVVIQGESVVGFWNARELSRALDNLIENAIKYGDDNKPISIRIVLVHASLYLHVHNEGSIPVDEQEGIFQPLQRSRSARLSKKAGWGIGLPIVRTIAEAHGGSISVDSAPDRGTTFTLNLPLDSRPFQDVPVL